MSPRLRFCCLAFALGLLLAACGGTKTKTVATTVTSIGTKPGSSSSVVRVYFLRGGKIAAAGRTVSATPAVARAALDALIAGPNASERGIGFTTSLPAGIELTSVTGAGGHYTVELSKSLNHAAQAQVVTTLTRFSSVRDVVVITPAGRSAAFTRADFEDVMPPVLVETPTPFQAVTSPLRVSGTSNVFEGTSQLELLDASGKLIATKLVTAGPPEIAVSSGLGARGSFDVTLGFKVSDGVATLISYVGSQRDGSHLDVVRIPVRISG